MTDPKDPVEDTLDIADTGGEAKTLREQVKIALDAGDESTLLELIDPLPRSAALRQLLALDTDDRDQLLKKLPVEIAAELVEEAPYEAASDLIERMDAGRAADVLNELSSDLQADLIGGLEEAEAEAILAKLDPDDAEDVRRLVEYEDETAGGLMVAEAFSFANTTTVGSVLRELISQDDDFERYRGQHLYIIDAQNHPVGVVSLRGLLTAKRSEKLTAIMVPPFSVSVNTTLDDLQDLFDEHNFLGLPVVEADGALVGVVSRSAVDAAVLERAESESLKRQGVIGDEVRAMPLWLRSRRRLAWLSTNIVLNIIAASAISAYEETLAAVIAIAVFLPMVSDMSGCSGNQAVGVTMRELSLGIVRSKDAFRVWMKEISVGVINRIALGINTVIAVSIGGVVPLLLKHLKQDPAAASGPLLTTITDMAGFFWYSALQR